MFEWLKTKQYDIYMLQEVHYKKEFNTTWKSDWGNTCVFSGNKSNSEGVAILFNSKHSIEIKQELEIIEGRILLVTIKVHDSEFTLINIYGPNKDDTNILVQLEKYILKHSDKTYIIGGDFNTVLNENMDKKNGNIGTHKKCREKLLELLNVANLTDSWRLKHPDKRQYTWHSNSKPHIHCRLDYFLISDNIINILKDTSISPGYKTDHSLVSLTLSTLKYERGPGYFKLNNSILTDENYQNNIRKCIIDTARNNNNCNANTLWEVIKGSIRNETIKYTTYLKKKQQ